MSTCHTVVGRISIGDDDPVEVNTMYGNKKVKRDIMIQDKTGVISFNIFTNRLDEIQDGQTFEITAMTLNFYQSMQLSRESKITKVEAIQGLTEAVKKQTFTIATTARRRF